MIKVRKANKELLSSKPLEEFLNNNGIEILIYNQDIKKIIINCIIVDDIAIGFCSYKTDDKTLQIAINSNFHNQGYGYILSNITITELFNNNVTSEIKCSTLIDRPSNYLVKKLGFEEISRTDKEITYLLTNIKFKKMNTKTFTIYSNLGFIGFAFIYNNSQNIQGTMEIFETFKFNNTTQMFPASSKTSIYKIPTKEIDILKDLISMSIPSYGSNQLTYRAVDDNNNSYNL